MGLVRDIASIAAAVIVSKLVCAILHRLWLDSGTNTLCVAVQFQVRNSVDSEASGLDLGCDLEVTASQLPDSLLLLPQPKI